MLRTLAPLLLLASVGCGGAEELPEILVVRDFTLTSHRGEPFAERSLEGHVWVASFVFTSCRDVCPLITNQVANLHRRVTDDRVRFVSISVDPRVDTPEVLAAYRARYRADDRWVFLTGDPAEVRRVVTEIFRVSMGEPSSAEGPYDIAHGEQLLLVDRRGVLRGQYPTDRAGMDRLARDIDRLLTAE
ncbi:MAG: SCO family protein [Sandaracinaceae bacterium]|nr:SCO family protein [Sandaracinaceae bacterium]